MARISKDAKQNDWGQPPSGIPMDDWSSTPISVRKLVASLLAPKKERRGYPENRFPILITLLLNIVIVTILTDYLEGKVVFPCISPHWIGPLSVAIISVIPLHLIWRNIYPLIPPNLEENIKVGFVTFPLKLLITLFNEMQIWKLPSRLMGVLLSLLLLAGVFLNLNRNSPFYIPDALSAIQGFYIQRFDKQSLEGQPVGGTLSITANEKVLVEAIFRNNAETTCTWYSAMSSENHKTGCSIVLDEPSRTNIDNLTVLIQSACGTQDFAGLNVVVLP